MRTPFKLLALATIAFGGCDDGSSGGGVTPDAAIDCTAGEQTCECLPDDTCNDGLSCELGFCVPAEGMGGDGGDGGAGGGAGGAGGDACMAGQIDCPCGPGGACDGALTCIDDLCVDQPAPTTGLRVEGAGAKGCEALFREMGTPTNRAGFAMGVTGQFFQRDGKIAIAFVSAVGADLAAVGGIELQGGATATAADLELIQSTCFDANGAAIDGATVILD